MRALEIWAYHMTKMCTRQLDARSATFLKAMLYRASPYYRRKLKESELYLLPFARWDAWDGEEE